MNKQKIISLIKASISLVNNYDLALPLQVQCQKYKLIQNLKMSEKDFNVLATHNKKAIGIKNIFENPNLRLTVYYLQEGNIMKLHDHNEMHVISKVLSGKMQAKLYKVSNKKQSVYEKKIKIFDPQHIFYIDGNKSFNLHEFRALQPTYFLDIIFPDYSNGNDCNFYQQRQVKSENQVILKKIDYEEIVFEDM